MDDEGMGAFVLTCAPPARTTREQHMFVRRIAAVAGWLGLATLVVPLTACDVEPDPADTEQVVIGVSGTRPGLAAVDADGTFSGLEVDLATYVARGLGWDADDLRFVLLAPDRGEAALADGDVDVALTSYAEPAEPADRAVEVAGPYLVAGQDLLVARDSRITGPHHLDGLTVCGETGSPALERLQAPDLAPGAIVRPVDDLAGCVDLLLAGEVDAVTADDVVLAGWAAEHPDDVRVVGTPFTTTTYDIALPEGSPDVAAVDTLVAQALADGTWQAAVDRWLGGSGYSAPIPPVP